MKWRAFEVCAGDPPRESIGYDLSVIQSMRKDHKDAGIWLVMVDLPDLLIIVGAAPATSDRWWFYVPAS